MKKKQLRIFAYKANKLHNLGSKIENRYMCIYMYDNCLYCMS